MATPRHLLLVAATTGYQVGRFREAAERLGVALTLATDSCHQLEDPWGDQAVPVRFDGGADAVKEALKRLRPRGPFGGVVACGDRAAEVASQLAVGVGVGFHPARAAAICHDKYAFRQVLQDAGLPAPWFRRVPATLDAEAAAAGVTYPCVLKPMMLSGSRGVIRANDAAEFAAAWRRIVQLLATPAIQQMQNPNRRWILIEGYIDGPEFALEGWIAAGILQRFALFDKPDPLAGPFFEESLYVAPSRLPSDQRAVIWDMVEAAARATGLGPGPIHAEIRLQDETAYVLEVAARPIGGLCARALRFQCDEQPGVHSLEELLIHGALGEPLFAWRREAEASGVMMIPIPQSGILEQVRGVEAAAKVAGIEAVEITAKPDQLLTALPEGASYLGFLFAHAATADEVEQALRAAYARLEIRLRPSLPVL